MDLKLVNVVPQVGLLAPGQFEKWGRGTIRDWEPDVILVGWGCKFGLSEN